MIVATCVVSAMAISSKSGLMVIRNSARLIVPAKRNFGEIRGQVIPLSEQVVLLAMPPAVRESSLRQLLFWGFCRVPRTVRAVRCACGRSASGGDSMGILRGLSTML